MTDATTHEPRRLSVRDVMTADPPHVGEESSLGQAAVVLRRSQASDLVVVDVEGRFVGVLSEGDLVRAVLPKLDEVIAAGGRQRDALDMLWDTGRSLADQPIARLVIRDAITVSPEDELLTAAAVMASRAIRRLPVVDGGRPIGTISRSDLCVAVLAGG